VSYLLEVDDLCIGLSQKKRSVSLVENVSFGLKNHGCLGIVGESGSGKSLTCKAIIGLLDAQFDVSGSVCFQGQNLLTLDNQRLRRIRGKNICMILQHPMNAFNPMLRIVDHLTETFCAHLAVDKRQAYALALDSLRLMEIKAPEETLRKYPHQLSGGMLQRIMIGIALALEPDLIIADEPTTALDSITQANIMRAFVDIRQRLGTSMIFISHDLGVINRIADDILVMHRGKAVEYGEKSEVLYRPKHEHSQFLVGTRQALLQKYYACLDGLTAETASSDKRAGNNG
jgi:nickel transport system ATP-binding protein